MLEPLPGGEYVIAVNGEKYRDSDPYPPTFHTQEKGSPLASRVRVADSAEVNGVNLALPSKRTAATLRVRVMGPDGGPCAGASVSLESLDGIERWQSKEKTAQDGFIEIPAFVGERYAVRASSFKVSHSAQKPANEDLEGRARADITGPDATVVVVLAPRNAR